MSDPLDDLLHSYQKRPWVRAKPTNADHIRSMSDEELAEFLMDVSIGMLMHKQIMNVEAWLRQPIEEKIEEDRS